MTYHPIKRFLVILVLVGLLSPACRFPLGQATSTATPESIPTPIPTSTPQVPRSLTICLGAEPNTLYALGGPNPAARSVLQAIYDGPVDMLGYRNKPVIFETVPSLADGEAVIDPVVVEMGDLIVDAKGNLSFLDAGLRVRPSGCRSDECAIVYDGTSQLEMDQMVVNFSLLEDLTWSDGEPLTSEDSIYAFNLDADIDTPGSKYLIDRTQTYEATDETSLQWWGIPGFIDSTYQNNFWAPLPKHAWEQFKPAELPQIDIASRTPIGWGPYVLQEWVAEDHLTLTKNERYFRSAENLPVFDELVFRIIPDPNSAMSEMVAGKCDVLDPTITLDGQLALLLQMEKDTQVQVLTSPTNTIEWLGLGINPATYDDGYVTSPPLDRPDYFYDKRFRQAISMCLDRQKVLDTVLFGLSDIPTTYIPRDHPLYTAEAVAYPYDPAQANRILEQVGWRDLDQDPSTPRQAQGVVNVPPLTPLVLNYYTSSATQRRQVSEILSQSLSACGIGVNLTYLSYLDLYAEGGAGGPLFGRAFDLSQYAMGTASLEPPCTWFTSQHIPTESNHWVGANVPGYKNPEFDSACERALSQAPDEPAYREAYQLTQVIFSTDLPAIPLYMHLNVAAARPDLCNFTLDPTANPLWNIESFDFGSTCNP
jgi:peptide/nickel transport system substrate-binding protein